MEGNINEAIGILRAIEKIHPDDHPEWLAQQAIKLLEEYSEWKEVCRKQEAIIAVCNRLGYIPDTSLEEEKLQERFSEIA